jgi:hypothetical protein
LAGIRGCRSNFTFIYNHGLQSKYCYISTLVQR